MVYFGTYTGKASLGIYVCRFDGATGALTAPDLAVETRNPTFLALHPSGERLYAVNEVDHFDGERSGAVSAFAREPKTGRLTLLNQQPSGGAGPCHLSLDHTGKWVFVANYGSGSVAVLPIQPDGRLGAPSAVVQHRGSSIDPHRQTGPHAHFILPDPQNRFALACDLGLDQVLVYRFDPAAGALRANEPAFAAVKPGSGPRHLAFHPDGRHVYLVSEMAATLTVFAWNGTTGKLEESQTAPTLPTDFKGDNLAAEVQIHPSGKFLYVSNRGHDSIALFSIGRRGEVAFVAREPCGGKSPRHFTLDPAGKWLLAENQDSNNVVVFAVDAQTGRLTRTTADIKMGAPVCSVFAPE